MPTVKSQSAIFAKWWSVFDRYRSTRVQGSSTFWYIRSFLNRNGGREGAALGASKYLHSSLDDPLRLETELALQFLERRRGVKGFHTDDAAGGASKLWWLVGGLLTKLSAELSGFQLMFYPCSRLPRIRRPVPR